jgi:hypothetical protein
MEPGYDDDDDDGSIIHTKQEPKSFSDRRKWPMKKNRVIKTIRVDLW